MLTIEQYHRFDREASLRLGELISDSFSPHAFQQYGYRWDVDDEQMLQNYVETMNAGSAGQFALESVMSSRLECEVIRTLQEGVRGFMSAKFGRPWTPITSIVVMLPLFRYVASLSHAFGLGPLRVLEAGPGAGYLSALLALINHRCIAHEVTPGLYVWQSQLFGHLFGDGFREMAGSIDQNPVSDHRVVHLPWWHYADSFANADWPVDVIVSRAMLAEMSVLARKALLRTAARTLGRGRAGLFVFDSIGRNTTTNMKGIHHELLDNGFRSLTTADLKLNGTKMVRPLMVYAAPGTRFHELGTEEVWQRTKPEPLRGVGPNQIMVRSGETEHHPLSELMPLEDEWLYPGYRFLEDLGYPTPHRVLRDRTAAADAAG